jgi:DNA-nicking Smr family endonuclease
MLEPLDGPIADTIDLHGFTAAQAIPMVEAFVRRVRRREPGALVHVVTGRGRGSPGRPVLKPKIRTLLKNGTLPVAHWGEDLDGGGYLLRLQR